jgi:hypothetical protein
MTEIETETVKNANLEEQLNLQELKPRWTESITQTPFHSHLPLMSNLRGTWHILFSLQLNKSSFLPFFLRTSQASIFSTTQAVPYAQTSEKVFTYRNPSACTQLNPAATTMPKHIPHLRLIEPHRKNRVSTPLHTLSYQPLHCRISRGVHQVGEISDLSSDWGSKKRADVCSPVPRPNGDTVDGAEDFDDAIPWQVVHGGSYDTMSLDEAAWCISRCGCFISLLRFGRFGSHVCWIWGYSDDGPTSDFKYVSVQDSEVLKHTRFISCLDRIPLKHRFLF